MFARVAHRLPLAAAILVTCVATTAAEQRTWTDNTGKFSVDAELVEATPDSVVLKKATGELITVPVARLSENDRQYLRTLVTPDSRPAKEVVRVYPSFPDAVTEVPPWNDANPPFDLAAFLRLPPAEENAAPLYLDALFEFEDLSYCFVPPGLGVAQYPDNIKRRMETARQRWNEFYRLDSAWEKDPESVDDAAIDAWLADYEVAFQKLAAAQQRPQCVFQTGLRLDTLLVHAQAVRQVARIAAWRTRRDIERGDLERPIEDLKTVLRLSRDLRPRGSLVCQLVSIAVDGICCNQIVPAILAAPGIDTRHCDRLLAVLAEHDAKAIDPFGEGARGEYFLNRFALHDLQHRTGTFDPRYMREELDMKGNVDSWVVCVQLIDGLGGGVGPVGRNRLQSLLSGANRSGGGEPRVRPLLPTAWTGGKVLSDDEYASHVDTLNRVFASLLELAERPQRLQQSRDTDALFTALYEPLWETTLGFILPYPAMSGAWQANLRETATLRGGQCLVALRRWQLDHPEPPPDLRSVVRAAGMDDVPIDPWSNQPLQMAIIDGDPVIYAVGPDLQDDKAEQDYLITPGSKGDLLFRLEVPERP